MRFSAEAVDAAWLKCGTCRDIAIVGGHVIVTASGVYARFFDSRSGETRLERFDGGERGDGACCVAGLRTAPIFSLVERRTNPRISVFAYPTMRKIASCSNSQEANGYAACAFAGTDYLLGQTTFPDFRIVAWHWRTGERMTATSASTLAAADWRLACSPDSPYMVARIAPDTGTLSVYRILVCSRVARLFPIEATDRKPVSASWGSPQSGALLLCDAVGNAWSLNLDEDDSHRVETIVEQDPRSRTHRGATIAAHRGGALVVRDLAEEDVCATLYRKSPVSGNRSEGGGGGGGGGAGWWRPVSTTSLPWYPIRAESQPRDDKILLLGEHGEIAEMVWPKGGDRAHPVVTVVRVGGDGGYAAISPLLGRYLAAIDAGHRLSVLDVSTGSLVGSAKLHLGHHGGVARVISCRTSPILATCTITGNCLVVDASAPSAPKISGCAHLQREPLDLIKFSDGGRVLGVGASQLGRLFLLVPALTSGRSRYKVASFLRVDRKVLVDFLIYEEAPPNERRTAKAVLLVGEAGTKHPRAGNEIAIYACQLSGDWPESAERAIEPASPLESIHRGREAASREIIGVPSRSRQLHRIELKPDFRQATLFQAFPSLHGTRNFETSVDCAESLLVSAGYDGSIVARDAAEPRRVLARFVGHHRSQAGVRAVAIVGGNAIVSLGRNGDLVLNRIPGIESTPATAPAASQHSFLISTEQDEKEEEEEEDWGAETWMDAMTSRVGRRSTDEDKRDRSLRISILRDLNALRGEVSALLDANQKESPNSRLPIGAFDLDRETRERKLLAAKLERDRLASSGEERIAQRNRACSYLRDRFLRPLLVRPESIYSMFGESKVTTYPLLEVEPREAEFRKWGKFSAECRELVSRLEQEEEEDHGVDTDPTVAEGKLSTSESMRDLLEPHRGYVEVLEACALAKDRERDLKIRFNERFEETRCAKAREIKVASDWARKTRLGVDELSRTFRIDATSKLLTVPRRHPAEIFDDALDSVSDSSANASVETKTEQASANGRADSVEDDDEDFHRGALERMMDGVLEVGLKDSANRSVPKPDCLARKHPSAYTEQDILAIESYERKVRAVRANRQTYRSMLESEIDRIAGAYRSGVRAFDDKLAELAADKVRTERSVLLVRLSKVQAILAHRKMVRGKRELRRAIDEDLAPAAKQAGRLADEGELLEARVAELRNRYENLRKRDKLLESRFRLEFAGELKQPMVEHLFRHYRRRPRLVAAACSTSGAFLAELAERVIDGRHRSDILPREWTDYLRGIDELEVMPVPDSLPSRLEPDHWHRVCRLRRLKVEAETKVRSCAIELAEAEQSLAFHRRATAAARAAASRRREAVHRLEKSLAKLTDDQDVRLLLRTGQLQVQPRGSLRADWQSAVLIPRLELVRVTEATMEVGERKVLALRRLLDLERITHREEWRHARSKLTANDLEERLNELRTIKVGRVARECCDRYRNRAASTERTTETVERDFDARQETCLAPVEAAAGRKLKLIEIEARTWRRRNARLSQRIDLSRLERDELVAATRDTLRSSGCGADRDGAFQMKKMRAIARKANLARKVRDSFRELTALESRLEILKLRTYPTLGWTG